MPAPSFSPIADDDPGPGAIPRSVSTLMVPEVRDYQRINAEVAQRLDAGETHVRLAGVEGQRLLLSGLSGPWSALVEVEGMAGPELAAEMNAPALRVLVRGSVADGAARGLCAGSIFITGEAGDALAYGLKGGKVVVEGKAGDRAGLNQEGGIVLVRGPLGRLSGERQSGGWFYAFDDRIGPHPGHGRRGGRYVRIDPSRRIEDDSGLDPESAAPLQQLLRDIPC